MRGIRSSEAKPKKKTDASTSRRRGGLFSLLGTFVAVAAAMGLLVAGVLLPAFGVAGASINSSVHLFNNMSGQLSENALDQQSTILAADGSVIATPYSQNRIVDTSAQIPKLMKDAQVAIEDQRFYEHGALDRRGIARAIAANLFSSGTQGASTLTQQYVKVLMQTQANDSGDTAAAQAAVSQSGVQGYARKLKQLKMAVDLEKTHTKDEILTSYLNLVYFGDQQYGIEAASRHYFGHSAKDLTLPEAATLAGVVNLPGTTDPIRNPAAAKTRRDIVLNKMAAQGMITSAQAKEAIATPIKTHITTFASGCVASKYPYYCDYVTDWLETLPALGKTRKERLARLQTGGLTIQTALDTKKMSTLDSQLKKSVPVNNPYDVQDAGVIIQPGTGLIQAMAQDSNYTYSGNNGFNTAVNYATAGFPIGSTAKLFAITTAMEKGQNATSTVKVPPMTRIDSDGPYAPFDSKNLGGPCGQKTGIWKVHNDDQVPVGPMSLKKATGQSVNTAFATLTGQLGACAVHDEFAKFGVRAVDNNTGAVSDIKRDPSEIVLGNGASSAVMLANAYATVAAEGKYCTPRPVVSIKQANGQMLNMGIAPCKQIITKDQALNTIKIFHGPLEMGGTAAADTLADGRDAFGKTGTVGSANHSWFVGATPQFSTAVWVGHRNGSQAIRNVNLGGRYIAGYVFGGDIAAPTWKAVMDEISKGQPKQTFAQPAAPKRPAAKKDDAKKGDSKKPAQDSKSVKPSEEK